MSQLKDQATSLSILLASAGALPSGDAQLSAAIRVAEGLLRVGDWTQALALLELCIEKCAEGASRREANLLAADAEMALERYEIALDRLVSMQDGLSRQGTLADDRVALRVRWRVAYALWGMNRLDAAEQNVLIAYRGFLALPDGLDLGWCACTLGHIAWSRGDLRGAADRYREAIVSADRVGSPELKATALKNLGLVFRQECRWQQAAEAHLEAARIWQRLEVDYQACHLNRSIAVARWKQGALEVASKYASDSKLAAERIGNGVASRAASLLEAVISIHSGAFSKAESQLADESGKSIGASSRLALLSTEFLGDVHLEQGQAAEALRYYDEVWPKAMALVPKGDIVAELRRRRAECYLLLGRGDEAFAAATDALAHCRELGDRYEEAATYRVLALSAAAVGKTEEAQDAFTQGFAYYEDIETPYEWGKLWLAYGDWLSGPNAGSYASHPGAREAYLAARDHFANMGARAKLAEAEERLAKLDAPVSGGAVVTGADATSGARHGTTPRRPRRRPSAKNTIDARAAAVWRDWYLVTRSESFIDMLERASKLARSEVSILITGETGTGKELIAAGMHRFSGLSGKYVALNCAAVPKEMIESELFGHVRGAFSGAVSDRAGLVESAAGGTLFLDEVGEMSEPMQAKMLRFLESGEYRRVGESTNRHVKTRLIAATNIARDRLSKGDGFRGDLFWRLGQSFVDVPALRHRKDDVPILLDHFLHSEAGKMGKELRFGEAAMAQLRAYPWPGNIRELIGVVRRAVALADSTIEPDHLDLAPADQVAVSLTEELHATERERLTRAMRENRNSPTLAARALGIPRTTLVMKLRRYKLR